MDKKQLVHIGAETAVLVGLVVYVMNENAKLRKEIAEIKRDVQITAQRVQKIQVSHGNVISSVVTAVRNAGVKVQLSNSGNSGNSNVENLETDVSQQSLGQTPIIANPGTRINNPNNNLNNNPNRFQRSYGGHQNMQNTQNRQNIHQNRQSVQNPQNPQNHNQNHHQKHQHTTHKRQVRFQKQEESSEESDDELLANAFGDSEEESSEEESSEEESSEEESSEEESPSPKPKKKRGKMLRTALDSKQTKQTKQTNVRVKKGSKKKSRTSNKKGPRNMDDIMAIASEMQAEAGGG